MICLNTQSLFATLKHGTLDFSSVTLKRQFDVIPRWPWNCSCDPYRYTARVESRWFPFLFRQGVNCINRVEKYLVNRLRSLHNLQQALNSLQSISYAQQSNSPYVIICGHVYVYWSWSRRVSDYPESPSAPYLHKLILRRLMSTCTFVGTLAANYRSTLYH